jgi:hypothetical protein
MFLPTNIPEFCRLPTSQVYFRDGTEDITSHEKRTLTYIQKRNNWTDHIFDSINWTAYRSTSSMLTENAQTFAIQASHG